MKTQNGKKETKEFFESLGFPDPSLDIIDEDGELNESAILNTLFKEIKDKNVQIKFRPSEEFNLPEVTINCTPACVVHIWGSYLEVINVSGEEDKDTEYLNDEKKSQYHPKNSGRKGFGFCCSVFHENHKPAEDDLLTINVRSLLLITREDKKIFELQEFGDRFNLELNGESMFKGYEDKF
jgi:hypothetical protein